MKTKTELIKFNQGLDLESGARLNTFDLMVETYGELNKDKDNAILVCHAFSGNHHAAGKSSDNEGLGWWDEIIGDGKTIDTKKYFVVSLNNLGGCHGSSGPTSIAAESGQPYGASFPEVSVSDWVETQKLLADHLGIDCWEMVAGGSLGGMQALQWAVSYPSRIKKAAIIAASSRLSGNAIKKFLIISMFQGLISTGITIAQNVLVRPIRSTRKYNGISPPLTTIVTNTYTVIPTRPGNPRLLST